MTIPFLSRTVSFGLVASLMLISTPAHARFFDVQPAHPYFDAIEYLTREGIVHGYENRSFRPSQNINRAEFTKILMSIVYTEEDIASCIEDSQTMHLIPVMNFPDVREQDWFAPYICAAWGSAIVSGYPDGSFRPEEGVNFAEAAKMLSLGFGLTGIELPNFGRDNVIWYQPYVEFLAANNAIPFSIESLDQPLDRGEMAELIYRLKHVPLGVTSPPQKSKQADDVIYPVAFAEYESREYGFLFEYPNVWPEPYAFSRGTFDGRSPYTESDWTVYFGPKKAGCGSVGYGDCVKRGMWVDGYHIDNSALILDAIEQDVLFIEVEEETIINRLPTLVIKEEIDTCIDKRAFLFGKNWIYALNVECGGQDADRENVFNQILQTFEERKMQNPEHY